MIRVIPAACALASLFMVAPTPCARALAEPVRDVFTPKTGVVISQTGVAVSAVDLSSEADRVAVLDRIEDAAEAVCQAKPPNGPEPTLTAEQAECRREAMARAVFQLHDPRLWVMTLTRVRSLGPSW